jgi:Uma2 family endonuclease
MTTMLAYHRQTDIDYSSLDFNPDEPEPLPDAMIQNPVLLEVLSVLAARFTENNRRPDVFLDSNTFICYNPNNLNVRVGPDCYLAFGVDARAIRERKLYLPWEAGKPPDFVLEVASETTARHDLTGKRLIYAQMGVPEYWRFDPTGGEHYGQPLAGDELVEGVYRAIDLITAPDGVLRGYSPVLGLYLGWEEGGLSLQDPETGLNLSNLYQTEEARRAAEAALRAEQEARGRAEAALRAEQEAREAAETRIRLLEQELRTRRLEG